MPPLPRLLIASQMLSTMPLGSRLPWTPPLRLKPLPPCCTYLLYSTSLRMPISRIQNPIPYFPTPPSHALKRGMRGGDLSLASPSGEPSVLALATTDIPVSPHTSNGEILAIVDSGTSKHILQCRTLLANANEAHVAVSSFAGDTSRSTYSGDLLCTVRTENGQLLPLSDTSSALVVPDAKRPLWSDSTRSTRRS